LRRNYGNTNCVLLHVAPDQGIRGRSAHAQRPNVLRAIKYLHIQNRFFGYWRCRQPLKRAVAPRKLAD
jgi:hypothetical protein